MQPPNTSYCHELTQSFNLLLEKGKGVETGLAGVLKTGNFDELTQRFSDFDNQQTDFVKDYQSKVSQLLEQWYPFGKEGFHRFMNRISFDTDQRLIYNEGLSNAAIDIIQLPRILKKLTGGLTIYFTHPSAAFDYLEEIGSLYVQEGKSVSLKRLKRVNGNVTIEKSKITGFPNLQHIGGTLDAGETPEFLPPKKLTYVGENCNIAQTSADSFDNLEIVEGVLDATFLPGKTVFPKLKRAKIISVTWEHEQDRNFGEAFPVLEEVGDGGIAIHTGSNQKVKDQIRALPIKVNGKIV